MARTASTPIPMPAFAPSESCRDGAWERGRKAAEEAVEEAVDEVAEGLGKETGR